MGDMRDEFDALKEHNKERKARNTVKNEELKPHFIEHTPYHWGHFCAGTKVDFYPTTNKWLWRGKKYYGTAQDCLNFIRKRNEEANDKNV